MEVAQLLGRHKSWVCRRLALREQLCDAAREELRLGLLTPALARELIRLPRGNQAAALQTARSASLTCRELSGVVDLLLASSTQEQTAFVCEDHLNPAVTLGFWIAKRFPGKSVLPYILSQLAGAFLASGVLRVVFLTHDNLGATIPSGAAGQSFVLEIILTAILMFVILAVSSGAKEKGLMAGIAVGGVIGFEALFAGPICGASMNPARSLAPAVVSGNMSALWVYLAAPIIGAALGVVACKLVHPPGCCQGGGHDSAATD